MIDANINTFRSRWITPSLCMKWVASTICLNHGFVRSIARDSAPWFILSHCARDALYSWKSNTFTLQKGHVDCLHLNVDEYTVRFVWNLKWIMIGNKIGKYNQDQMALGTNPKPLLRFLLLFFPFHLFQQVVVRFVLQNCLVRVLNSAMKYAIPFYS